MFTGGCSQMGPANPDPARVFDLHKTGPGTVQVPSGHLGPSVLGTVMQCWLGNRTYMNLVRYRFLYSVHE